MKPYAREIEWGELLIADIFKTKKIGSKVIKDITVFLYSQMKADFLNPQLLLLKPYPT